MKLPATCVVFCGGASKRMGRDKALLDWRGVPLGRHVAKRLEGVFEATVVSGDPALYASLGYPCIPDLGGAGPLAGLYSALFSAKTTAVFAVACDMPFVEPEAVRLLWKRFQGRDAAMPLSQAGPEPLHAFYAKRILPAAGRALEGMWRMSRWGRELDVALIPVADLPRGATTIRDCDTLADYNVLRGRRSISGSA